MLIFLVIMHLILIFIGVLMIYEYKKIYKLGYEYCIRSSKVFGILIYVFYFALTATEIGVYINDPLDESGNFPFVCIIYVVLHLFLLFLLYIYYFHYDAIKGDKIYFHRMFFSRSINIQNINYFNAGAIFLIVDKKSNSIYRIYTLESKKNKFIFLIEKKKAELMDAPPDDSEVLISLKKEYQNNYKSIKRKIVITYLFHLILVILLLCGLSLFAKDLFYVWKIAVPYAVVKLIILFIIIIDSKSDLKLNDLEVGIVNKYFGKYIKEPHHTIYTMLATDFGFVFLFFMFVGFLACLLKENPVSYENLITVTMKFKEYDEHGYNDYFTLKFSDVEVEYYLIDYTQEYHDFSFIDEINEGDSVTLLVGKSNWSRVHYVKDEDKHYTTYFNYIYGIKVGEKDYFTYNDYIKIYDDYFRDDEIMYYSLGVSMSMVLSEIILYFVYKSKVKSETVDI